MDRRSFIKFLTAASAVSACTVMPDMFHPNGSAVFGATSATTTPAKTLLVIFQRGANDGINTVIPYGDPNYNKTLRPTLFLDQAVSGQVLKLTNQSFFGLHPSLTYLQEAFNNGKLALMPAVHWSEAPRSHFDAQKIIELGKSNLTGYDPATATGWLNRYLVQRQSATPVSLRAIGLESSLIESLHGAVPVSVYSDLSRVNGSLSSTEAAALSADQANVYNQAPATDLEADTYTMGKTFVQDLSVLRPIDFAKAPVDNGAVYSSSTFDTQLRQIATLIKANLGLEIATASIGGWDSHLNQGGVTGMQATSLSALNNGLKALMTDLGSTLAANLVVLVMTEFGRTAAETASFGTDHGKASCWMVLGGPVKGRVYGRAITGGFANTSPYTGSNGWPGLSSTQLDSGRFLKNNVDYREILGEILNKHLGMSTTALASILPGYTYNTANALGFL